MRNNQLEHALLRAGFVKATAPKQRKQTHVHDVHESDKPAWEALTLAERKQYEQQFNALN